MAVETVEAAAIIEVVTVGIIEKAVGIIEVEAVVE